MIHISPLALVLAGLYPVHPNESSFGIWRGRLCLMVKDPDSFPAQGHHSHGHVRWGAPGRGPRVLGPLKDLVQGAESEVPLLDVGAGHPLALSL